LGALAGQRVVAQLRQRLQWHTLRLPTGFFDAHQSGGLVARIISDTEQVRNLLGAGVLQVASGVLSAVLAFTVLVYIDPWLTFLTAALLLVMLLALTRAFSGLHPAFRSVAELQAELAGKLTQVLGGIRVVKTCGAERLEAHAFTRDTHRVLRVSLHASRRVSALIATIALASGVVSLVLLVLGGQAVAAGAITLGDLALFVFLVGILSTPLMQAAAIGSDLGRAWAALARIAEVLALPTEDVGDTRRLPVPAVTGGVVFDDVSYAYLPGRPVLSGVSFSAPPGSITALTGPNGAGKSTLLSLLMRLDNPTAGRILLDGRPLGSVRLREYRRHLGVVLQANDLFDGTLRQNICYGRPGATTGEFRRAVRLACCDEFVDRLPDGYDTLVGERGVRLSGGQRQRVAIARAMLAAAGEPRSS
jgi:subfamily B ATP-binding cassette protein MsbA